MHTGGSERVNSQRARIDAALSVRTDKVIVRAVAVVVNLLSHPVAIGIDMWP